MSQQDPGLTPPTRRFRAASAGQEWLSNRVLLRLAVTLVLSLVALQVVQWGLSAVSHVLFLILLAWLLSIAMASISSSSTRS